MNEQNSHVILRDWEKTILWFALAITLYANQDRTGPMAIVGLLIVGALAIKVIELSKK